MSDRTAAVLVYRYMIVGRAREMGLGSFGNLTLEEARELARQHRRGVQQKPESGGPVDPLHERQAAEIRGIREVTFRQAADDYLAANRDSWKSAKHRQPTAQHFWTGGLETAGPGCYDAVAIARAAGSECWL